MPDYSQGKIYKITNDFNDKVYIGSTCERLNIRFHKHRFDSKKDDKQNRPLYQLMNEIGIERFRIDLIENYPCNDKIALGQREGHFIREMGTLNIRIEGRSRKSYYQDNIDYFKEHNKTYRHENKDLIKEYQMDYRQDNADTIQQYQREYQQKNADKLQQYQREYRQQNADKHKEYDKARYQRKKLGKQGISDKK
jgi:hypothetical protein